MTEPISQQLIEAINLQTKAIKYLADVIGYKADNENPVDTKGVQKVKLDETIEVVAPHAEDEAVTFEHIKTAINIYAKAVGKDKALEVVKKYANGNTSDIKDIPKESYHEFFVSCEV